MLEGQVNSAESKIPVKNYWNPAESKVEKQPNDIVIGRGQAAIMQLAHWHMQIELNYVMDGAATYEMCGRAFSIQSGEVALFWGGFPHRLADCAAGTQLEAIHLPLSMYFQLRVPESLREALMQGNTLLSAAGRKEDRHTFRRLCGYLRSDDPQRVQHAGQELMLRIERIAFEQHTLLGRHETAPVTRDSASHQKVRLMLDFLMDNYREEIDVTAVATHANLHPKYAMGVFKSSTGITVNEYIQLLRLNYAQALLMREEGNILEIATDSGFGSLSNFNRCFRKHTGLSPSKFRRYAHRGPMA